MRLSRELMLQKGADAGHETRGTQFLEVGETRENWERTPGSGQ